jgi:hypothetical protein
VAGYIGKPADRSDIDKFVSFAIKYAGKLDIPGIRGSLNFDPENLEQIAGKYLYASQKAGEIYRKIAGSKGEGNFITEVSMDEVANPQTPLELFFILAMLGQEEIPLQTIAPKFSGRFNKGVDYSGDPGRFAEEFEDDILVIRHAVKEFGLPGNLKISVHSGSDKFSIYGHIRDIISRYDQGIHVKTAGTTWLEEIIGLAEAGGEALVFVKEVYSKALEKINDLCAPYADVIDINTGSLPSSGEVAGWGGKKFADSLRHIPENSLYNPDMRQLLHVAYKIAAERSEEWFRLLEQHEDIVSECVFENIYHRHICRLFGIE